MVIDFDQKDWLWESRKVMEMAYKHNFYCYLERSKSGNGGHLWFFFENKISASKSRQVAQYFLYEADLSSESSFDRIFPTQDGHTGKGFGNLIALPLHGQYLKKGNTAFINSDGEIFPNQWEYLQSFSRIPENRFDEIIEKYALSSFSFVKPKAKPISRPSAQEESEIKIPNRKVKLTLSNFIHISHESLPSKLHQFLKEKLIFSNPRFYQLEGRGYSTWNTPRVINVLNKDEKGILIPPGFLPEIEKFATQNGLTLIFNDERALLPQVSFQSKIKLYPDQQIHTDELLKHNRIILEAGPGFGKTMVALHCIAARKQKTLIIVHTKVLLYQWRKRIEDNFELQKGDLGIIGDHQWEIGNKITIASYQTLMKRERSELKEVFGFIIIDECHHVPARTFSETLSIFSARYVLGLTATAIRKDKLERLMGFYIGPIFKASTSQPKEADQGKVQTDLMLLPTQFQCHDTSDFHQMTEILIRDPKRNEQIIDTIISALQRGAKCLVLTERIDHCQILLSLLRKKIKGIHADIAEGRMTKKERERITKRMTQDRFQLLIATGKLIGEGFDWPELTHLFLAFPFSWKGKLIQYVGRIQRAAPGKKQAYIHDYLDHEVPMLKLMYFNRLRTYKKLGLVQDQSKVSSVTHSNQQLNLFDE